MKLAKFLLLIILSMALVEPVSAYYHKFIAENSGTRKLRSALHYALTVNPNPTMADYATGNTGGYARSFSHILFVGTPK